jgi:pimeloyl-ACP methyl ester carboxylesterase
MTVSSKFFRIGVLAAALLAASLTIVLWGSSGAEPAAAAPSTIPPSTIQSEDFFVETLDGVSIHVSEKVRSGGTKKVPILLVHALWNNSQSWDFPGRSVMNYLATNGYDVYALDLRGMGESEHPADYNTIGLLDRVKDLEAVASYIKNTPKNTTHRPPVVLGTSQGGALTGVLAGSGPFSRPDLVSGVGLFSVPGNEFFVPPKFQERAVQVIESGADRYHPLDDVEAGLLSREDVYALDFGFDPVTGRPTMSNAAYETYSSLTEADGVRATLELVSPEFYHANVTPSWSQIKAPALVVDGAQDSLVGEERARALYDALGSKNKDLIIFNRNAHAWFVEDNYKATQSRAFDEFLEQFDQ